jgi:hypothetical protein
MDYGLKDYRIRKELGIGSQGSGVGDQGLGVGCLKGRREKFLDRINRILQD